MINLDVITINDRAILIGYALIDLVMLPNHYGLLWTAP